MKLLVVSHACITPVNQSFYADLAAATGWDVSLVIPSTWTNEYKSTAEVARWPSFKGDIHAIPVWKAGNIPLHLYRRNLIDFLRVHRPDSLYVHHEPYGLATGEWYLANRVVGQRPIGFYAAQNILKQYPLPIRWMEQRVFAASSFAFPVTEGALQVLREKGYQHMAEVLPLPVDATVHHPDPQRATQWRSELGIAADEFVIGYLGRLVEEKGLATLLHALKLLPAMPWRCVLAGSGPFESTLKALAHELGIAEPLIWTGFVPHTEAPGLLAAFDVLMLPSEARPNWKEQFGRVIVEANACGTAVIGTDSGEIANVLRKTGGGVCVPEKNPHALAAAIVDLVTHPDKLAGLVAHGQAAVRQQFDQSFLVSRFAQTIEAANARVGAR